jgi:hypothetical protein
MKFEANEVKELLAASYEKKHFDIGKFKIVKSLSDIRVKTYLVDNASDIIVTHRGSASARDWVDNTLWLKYNILTNASTFKRHLKKHKRVVDKYGANNIIVMGHSRGGLYATEIYDMKLAKQLINYNKPVNMYDIAKDVITKKKQDQNTTNINTSRDIISVGQKLLKDKDTDIVIPSNSFNPLKEHGIDKIDDYETDELIGKGIFKPQINYSKIRKKAIRDFVKQKKKKVDLNVNVTGLTKKELIKLSEYILTYK